MKTQDNPTTIREIAQRVDCLQLPDAPAPGEYYYLPPVNVDIAYYRERTDRNIGWLTREEQDLLFQKRVGVAGCGGMGGLLASIFVRLGIGEVRIADSEVFDASNINRQYAARRDTIGKFKAFETAKMTRQVSDDAGLLVFPQGICEESVTPFVEGCDVICDEIEFWAIGSRILLHREARKRGVTVLNCNTVGFGTRLFRFDPAGYQMEDLLGFDYEEAKELQRKIVTGKATPAEVNVIMEAALRGLVPELPEYGKDATQYSSVRCVFERLFKERRAMIITPNPHMASGFLGDHVLFHLLRDSPIARNIVKIPEAPSYLYFDAAFHEAKSVERKEVRHEN